jgi:cobalt-zinc-cadmium efflux system membrane fusion protein
MKRDARGKVLALILAAVCLAGLGGAVIAFTWRPASQSVASKPPGAIYALRLAPGSINTLELSAQLINALGMRTVQVQSAANHDHLVLSGFLSFDPNRMVRVHSRFGGEVVSMADARVGERVKKGQLLAVIRSKDIGEKKSELVDGLSSYYVHEAQLNKLKKLEGEVIAGKLVREAEREFEADVIRIDRIERTLRSWRVPEAEIKAVRTEAEKIHSGDAARDAMVDKSWAEVKVLCPFDGTVLEKNGVPGDMIDTNLNLFIIADLSVLCVMAHVVEEDIPALESLKGEDQRWTIAPKSQPGGGGVVAKFDRIGSLVDPSQHVALMTGWLDNPDGRWSAGQAITATVELPTASDEVVIPDTALVQDGPQSVVFVAANETGTAVTRRNVALVSRGENVAYIRSQPTVQDEAQGCGTLKPGEWIVTAGSIELDGALDSALATTSQRDSVKN